MNKTLKEYIIYLIRWQISTPIVAFCLWYFGGLGELPATMIANLIGGLIFFWVDRLIFNPRKKKTEYLDTQFHFVDGSLGDSECEYCGGSLDEEGWWEVWIGRDWDAEYYAPFCCRKCAENYLKDNLNWNGEEI